MKMSRALFFVFSVLNTTVLSQPTSIKDSQLPDFVKIALETAAQFAGGPQLSSSKYKLAMRKFHPDKFPAGLEEKYKTLVEELAKLISPMKDANADELKKLQTTLGDFLVKQAADLEISLKEYGLEFRAEKEYGLPDLAEFRAKLENLNDAKNKLRSKLQNSIDTKKDFPSRDIQDFLTTKASLLQMNKKLP